MKQKIQFAWFISTTKIIGHSFLVTKIPEFYRVPVFENKTAEILTIPVKMAHAKKSILQIWNVIFIIENV